MHAVGVRGVRLNLVNRAVLDVSHALELCREMAPKGWHLHVQLALAQRDAREMLGQLLRESPVPIVIDHLGRSAGDAASAALSEALASGRAWVKLSAPYRFSADGPPAYADVARIADRLVQQRPDRVLWASDWPHTELEAPLPSVDGLLDALMHWLPRVDERYALLVANPATLYGFSH